MTLTDREALNLEQEFLQQDLGRLPAEMPVTSAARDLTRALYERSTADEGVCPRPLIPAAHAAIQDAVRAVVAALDKVVTAWEASSVVLKAQPQVVDGVRAAATFIAEAAAQAGLSTPAQPTPAPRYAVEPAQQEEPPAAPTEDELLAAQGWVPSDGGLTPSMFGGI